jgi:hypothetical protein
MSLPFTLLRVAAQAANIELDDEDDAGMGIDEYTLHEQPERTLLDSVILWLLMNPKEVSVRASTRRLIAEKMNSPWFAC